MPPTGMQPLKRIVDPYVGQVTILGLVSLFVIFVAVWKHVPDFFFVVPAIWILFSPLVYLGLRYRIYWNGEAVCQDASGIPRLCIGFGEITKVALEGGDFGRVATAAAHGGDRDAGRPFRRIALYKHGKRGERNFIDVSLKHFADADIRALMQAIHARRPDLTLPRNWT
jgi:hypothetical protein